MEIGEAPKTGWKDKVAQWLGRKNPKSEPMKEAPQTEVFDEEAISKAFDVAANLLVSGSLSEKSGAHPIDVTRTGGIEMGAMAELMNSQETIRLSDAKAGDVVWWKDTDGKNGYFLVRKPYTRPESRGETGTYGRGSVRVEIEDKTIESPDGCIHGASFGGMLKVACISKNIPVKFAIPNQFASEVERQDALEDLGYLPENIVYFTETVESMGIIRKEELS